MIVGAYDRGRSNPLLGWPSLWHTFDAAIQPDLSHNRAIDADSAQWLKLWRVVFDAVRDWRRERGTYVEDCEFGGGFSGPVIIASKTGTRFTIARIDGA